MSIDEIIEAAVSAAVDRAMDRWFARHGQPPPPSDYLSPQEVADLLGVHRETVYAWMRDGRIRSCRAGRVRRIRRVDLEAFMNSTRGNASDTDIDAVVDRILARRR